MPKDIIINNQTIKPGQFLEVNLNVYRLPTRTFIEIPVHVFRSKKDGPVLLLIAGMHGDEINGIEIIRRLLKGNYFQHLLCGSVIVIPILNIVSFINGSRDLPDGRDLNRCFPGSSSGSLGSRIAKDLMDFILPNIDLGVDFHTGGAKINNYPQERCVFNDKRSLELAQQFAPPFILNSPYREKTFRHEASKKKKPILVFEGGESLRFNTLAIKEGLNGCLRLMNNLGMLQSEIPQAETRVLKNTKWVRAKMSGLFSTEKKYGSYVEKNEIVGVLSDPFGDTETPLKAPDNGYIIGINNKPVINEGDAVIHIGTLE